MKRRQSQNIDRLSRELVADVKQYGSNPLLFLPSTHAALYLLERCAHHGMPVEVVGNHGWVTDWQPALSERTHSPLGLWKKLKTMRVLPYPVAVFQDQLVSVDDSYQIVRIDAEAYHVSPIEVMLLMRFRPRTFLGRATPPKRTGAASGLALVTYTEVLPQVATRSTLEQVMTDVIRPLTEIRDSESVTDWHARLSFDLKKSDNYKRLLSQRIQEIEALMRIYQDHRGVPSSLATRIESLRASRLELINTRSSERPQEPRQETPDEHVVKSVVPPASLVVAGNRPTVA